MTVESGSLNLHTRYEGEILDITEKIQAIVAKGNIRNGAAFLFVPGSTAALTTLEYEPGLLVDLPSMLETTALLGPDLFVPIREKSLVLGTWQQIVFIELDVRSRDRTLVVQLIGE